MRKRMSAAVRLVATFGILMMLAACSSESSQPGQASDNAKAGAEKATPPSDKGDRVVTGGDLSFMMDAATGGMAEVELGRLATERAVDKDVKQFAQRMITDHTGAGAGLKQLAAQKKVTPPAELTPKQKETMEKLAKLNGADFDREYVKAMVEDHVKDVTAFDATAKGATDQDVKAYAAKTLPTLQEHLKMIRDIDAKMGAKPKS